MESLGKSPSVFSVELMTDYMSAIVALVAVTCLLTEGLLFVLKQPTDLPMIKLKQRSRSSRMRFGLLLAYGAN